MLETEYFTAEDDPGFDFATVRDLADRNRDLCDQIGEARLRNVTPVTLSRGLSDADTCAAIGKMQKRTAASWRHSKKKRPPSAKLQANIRKLMTRASTMCQNPTTCNTSGPLLRKSMGLGKATFSQKSMKTARKTTRLLI